MNSMSLINALHSDFSVLYLVLFYYVGTHIGYCKCTVLSNSVGTVSEGWRSMQESMH